MRNRGFTLIELLAVIVILIVIALIATPIILNMIGDTKESTALRSAEFYNHAVELAIPRHISKGGKIADDVYDVLGNGNLCLEYKENNCDKELQVEVSGEMPNIGSTVEIESGKVRDVILIYNENTIVKENGKLVYADSIKKE